AYTHHVTEVTLRLLARARGHAAPLRFPLDYPDSGGEFYGYERRASGEAPAGMKELVLSTGFVATALVALKAGRCVASKRECAALYREHVGDEWTSFVEEIYETCAGRWAYRIPEKPDERQQLRELCGRKLVFEN